MKSKKLMIAVLSVGIGAITATGALIAQDSGEEAAPAMELPPGWTMEDMQACMMAATPGEIHKLLLEDVGSWKGTSKTWMMPGGEPVESEVSTEITSLLDGHYIQLEMNGEMPGMGPYKGMGMAGFDNVSQELVATWVDNFSTGIMYGTGKLSEDKKVMTWNYSFNCPVTKEKTPFREVDTVLGPGKKKIEMYTIEPKSGVEYKIMEIVLTKQ